MSKINKSQLATLVSEKLGSSKAEGERVLNAVLESVTESLARGEEVALVGFGTFKVQQRAERMGKNPKTGEEIHIKASKSPAFKAGKSLKDSVNI